MAVHRRKVGTEPGLQAVWHLIQFKLPDEGESQGKAFFFEKKKQKTSFRHLVQAGEHGLNWQQLLVLFLEKDGCLAGRRSGVREKQVTDLSTRTK